MGRCENGSSKSLDNSVLFGLLHVFISFLNHLLCDPGSNVDLTKKCNQISLGNNDNDSAVK